MLCVLHYEVSCTSVIQHAHVSCSQLYALEHDLSAHGLSLHFLQCTL